LEGHVKVTLINIVKLPAHRAGLAGCAPGQDI